MEGEHFEENILNNKDKKKFGYLLGSIENKELVMIFLN